jgi:hypothetical protein
MRGNSLDDGEASRRMGGGGDERRGFLWSHTICIKSQSGMQADP